MVPLLYLLFVLSGAAGLIYESIWTRYLGLFVGHSAYAQIVVLVIFLGGMAAGALVVSRFSERIRQPLLGYALVEAVVGGIGFVFHDGFQWVTEWAHLSVYPALAGSPGLVAAKWGIAGALLLPQSVLLGATFPLMSAGVLRLNPAQPGRVLSLLYFTNSLGAAAGVLIAGFYLIAVAGLPGTLRIAAALNLLVAVGTIAVALRARRRKPTVDAEDRRTSLDVSRGRWTQPIPPRALLLASFGTAVASFIYEIDWLRMLALVLGSATHAFELMLSAFILGLALGAFWVRSRADRFRDPVAALGLVQLAMGSLALATLLLYVASFGWIGTLMTTFAETDAGYAGFTMARYGICLAIMLPATFCAGMTLPLITRILVAGGIGEEAIGTVYSWNTFGSIVGVVIGGFLLLPLLGLKGSLITAALLDMGIGVALLGRRRLQFGMMAGAWTAAAVVIAIAAPALDPVQLTSGVFRTGVGQPTGRSLRFYADGRTATVTGYTDGQLLVISTNGKPDASLGPIWFRPCSAIAEREPLTGDAATQLLVPLVTLAHAPGARSAAVIGQGSGMSSHFLLGSPALDSLVTIEIEPKMVAGSAMFYPANRRVFDDPRSHIVIDDAKSYFAAASRQYDIIVSEPSNPWVSGVSGLFTDEFYGRVRRYLSEGGVFGQWLHMYELDDELVLSVLAAIHRNFPAYEIYLAPKGDLLVVASNRPVVPAPDWSVVELPEIQQDLCRFVPLTPAIMNALHLVGRHELRPLLDRYEQPNSDFFPVLDLGAERRRFYDDYAEGFLALSADWFNLIASFRRQPADPGGELFPPFPDNPRLRARAVATFLQAPSALLAVRSSLWSTLERAFEDWERWQARLAAGPAPMSWQHWLRQARAVEALRQGGAAGRVDHDFYASMQRFLDRHDAPLAAHDVVAFRRAIAGWDFLEAARRADRLARRAGRSRGWIDADELRDGGVIAKLHVGDVDGARRLLDDLASLSRRGYNDLRSRLLEAYVSEAENPDSVISSPRAYRTGP